MRNAKKATQPHHDPASITRPITRATFEIDTTLYREFGALAKSEDRSTGAQIRVLMREWIEAKRAA